MQQALMIFAIFTLSIDVRAAPEPRTYLLAVANGESFDRDLPVLHYAHDDLARFIKVMTRTGMIPEDHVLAFRESTRAQLRDAFKTLSRRIAAQHGQATSKFIFFYTGHSDATGLHLADGLLRKDELHDLIGSVGVEARIAFFDGCYSGALAAKGIKPATDFIVPKAEFDEPTGSVFFAATSGSDVAFEVEELKGSLFSHNLVGGLYGAADGNRDGLVTVDELYQHVYKQMAFYASSLPTGRGQKPEYSVDLKGKGALVLSYLNQTTTPVELPAGIVGELTLTSDGGLQTFRVTKKAHVFQQLMLVPGDYAVALRDGDQLGRGTLMVRPGAISRLDRSSLTFETAHNLDTISKGQRSRARWGVAMGASVSTYTKFAPSVEAQIATPAKRVESSDWRLVAYGGGRQNDLKYREQTGTSQSASLILGTISSIYSGWGLAGQQWRLLAGLGFDYMWQHWDHEDDPDIRRFENFIPKVTAGFGTAFTTEAGMVWGLNFRREFPFAKDRHSGDVLAFGTSSFAVSFEW